MWTLVIFVVSIFIFKKLFSSRNNLPPGPRGIPLLGNILQIGRKPHVAFGKWSKIYGSIYSVKLGPKTAIILSDHKMIKEMFNDKVSGGRIASPFQVFSQGNFGVLNTEGKYFDVQKAFILRTLKDLGVTKNTLDYIVLSEVKGLTSWLESKVGSAVDGNYLFSKATANILVNFATGVRYEWEKGDPTPIVDAACAVMDGISKVCGSILMFAPFLKYVAPKYFHWTAYTEAVEKMIVLIDQQVEEHKKTIDPTNVRDFVDAGLVEIEKCQDPESCFYKERGLKNLKVQVLELFLGGSDSTATMLSWCMLFLSRSPKVQEQLQNEIDQVVGRHQPPSLFDREKMPYTRSVITETYRLSRMGPLGVPHKLLEDKRFHGYLLRKNSIVIANFKHVQEDPKLWGNDAHVFKPERFLSGDGIVLGNEAVMPFSVGYRKCMGYSLAHDTLFIFLVSICQKFTILPGDKRLDSYEGYYNLLHTPKEFDLVFQPRKIGSS